jgi:hypothetical protein
MSKKVVINSLFLGVVCLVISGMVTAGGPSSRYVQYCGNTTSWESGIPERCTGSIHGCPNGYNLVNCPGGGGDCFGTDGNDCIIGSANSDEIFAGKGNDYICAYGSADIVRAGFGDDIVCGGSGADLLKGGWGDDSMGGGSDTDTLEGGQCDDYLYGGSGTDLCKGGNGTDTNRQCEAPSSVGRQGGRPSKCNS